MPRAHEERRPAANGTAHKNQAADTSLAPRTRFERLDLTRFAARGWGRKLRELAERPAGPRISIVIPEGASVPLDLDSVRRSHGDAVAFICDDWATRDLWEAAYRQGVTSWLSMSPKTV